MSLIRALLTFGIFLSSFNILETKTYAADTLYNMTTFLKEPYPLIRKPIDTPATVTSTTKSVTSPSLLKERVIPSKQPLPRQSVEKIKKIHTYNKTSWFSETRVGVLKHAVSLKGNSAKETGIDANIELLLHSPGWLNFLWSPRPHFGMSVNSSSSNTDVAYAGITWDWIIWKDMFFNFGFGFATHNGKLAYDPKVAFPSDYGRHREFGCRVLFRESFEAGWQVVPDHAISLMWSHYSHAGICGDQNEGLDNLGVRYGYRF